MRYNLALARAMSITRPPQVWSLGWLLGALAAWGCGGITQRTVEERDTDANDGGANRGGAAAVDMPHGGRAPDGHAGKSASSSGGASGGPAAAGASTGAGAGGVGVELDPVPVSDRPPPACSCGEGCAKLDCDVSTFHGNAAFLMNVFVKGDQAYWMSREQLARFKLGGGGQIGMASQLQYPSRVVVDADFAYFSSFQGLWKLPRAATNVTLAGDGGSAKLLSSLQQWERRLCEITVDSRDVYWTSPPTAQIPARLKRTPTEGGASVVLAELPDDQDWPLGIAVDDTDVYFTSNSSLQRIAKAGGSVQALEAIGAQVSYDTLHPTLGIALDTDYVYFDGGTALRRLSKQGGTSSILFEVPEGDALAGVVVDADFAYFGTRSGGIYRVGKLGGAPRSIVSGEDNPLVTAVSADAIFWIEQDLGYVKQVAK